MKNKLLKINDPIHGFVLFPQFITNIVDSKEIQRLMRIRQLSGVNHVFPGANHTRFEHSLGVAALALRLVKNLRELHEVELTDQDQANCIVAALCHDIGHGPFSHNFEGLLMENTHKDHEDYTEWIIKSSEIGDIIENLGMSKKHIAEIATGKTLGKGNDTGALLSQTITGAINVDSMDYLLRDNYHCGTQGRPLDINRLLLSIDMQDDGILGVNLNALIALEGFLLSRISSFRTIYFHKTCRAVQLMLSRGIQLVSEEIGLFNYQSAEDFTKWDDYTLWAALVKSEASRPIMEKIMRRQLLKSCYESRIGMTALPADPQALRLSIAERAGVDRQDIFLDFPSSPNIPYNHIDQTRTNEIYTFKCDEAGKKESVELQHYSSFFHQFKGNLELIRVYTWPENRKRVGEAALNILGKPNNFSASSFNQ